MVDWVFPSRTQVPQTHITEQMEKHSCIPDAMTGRIDLILLQWRGRWGGVCDNGNPCGPHVFETKKRNFVTSMN